jgi:hypothetical protein
VDELLPRLTERRARFAAAAGKERPDPTSRERLIGKQAIVGDPQECLSQLETLMRTTGVEALRCYFNANGALANDVALDGMELFAREVLPAARQLNLGG